MRILKLALAGLALCGCAEPPEHIEHLTAGEIQSRVEQATAATPTIVFGAVWEDGRTLVRVAGEANAQTPFAWFSITKLFTATAILQLAEQGRIDLDAPASRYLPDVRLIREGREATVRDLLSHASGLPNPVPITWIHLASEPAPSLDDMIRLHIGSEPKLDFVPGSRHAYSNLGYLLLGRMVERVTGQVYPRYVEDKVLAPLGCRDAGFAVPADRAAGYQNEWSFTGLAASWMLDRRFFGQTKDGRWETRPFTVDGAPYGGLSGSVDCLLGFARMILNGGEGLSGRVLSRPSVEMMLRPSGQAPFALAWRVGTLDGEPYAEHLGGGGGFCAGLRLYPRLGYAVAVLGNESSFAPGAFLRIVAPRPAVQ